jgi:hypothetical protein
MSPIPGTASVYPPFFFPLPGWHVVDGGRVPRGAPSVAWASTVPFHGGDLPLRTGYPLITIDRLKPNGIVISVMATPWYFKDQGPWPKGSWTPPDLSTADVRGPEAEEPARSISVYEIEGPYALTRVYCPFRGRRAPIRSARRSSMSGWGPMSLMTNSEELP